MSAGKVPRFRKFTTKFDGLGGAFNGVVWNQTVRALLASEGHLRLRNGSWSGGGPFFQTSVNQEHWGLYEHPSYVRLGVGFPATKFLGVSPCPIGPPPSNLMSGLRTAAQASTDVSSYFAAGYNRARPGRPAGSLGQFLVEGARDFPAIPALSSLGLGPKQAFMRWLQGDGPQAVNPLNGRFVPVRKLGPSLLDGNPARRAPRGDNPAWRALQRLSDFRNLGHEYLNIVFGWEPFVRDLQKLYRVWKDIDKRIAQLIRENGKGIRRKATVSEDKSSSQTQTFYPFPWANVNYAVPSFGTGGTWYTATTTTYSKIWFTANFRYFIPDIGSSRWTQKATRVLFGVQPTPELLWTVLPWSWLVDWFSNAQDTIANLNDGAVENLTFRNGYIMKHTYTQSVYHAHVYRAPLHILTPPASSWDGVDHSFNSFFEKEEKIREGGWNPFGLHVQFPDLTARQVGILAALGLTRSLVR